MTIYVVTGLVVDSVYAIATLGLVLTYSSTRIFNFAHGAIAYFLAIVFDELSVEHGWNERVAGGVTILVVSPLLGLLLWTVLFRRLADTPPSVRLVSTIGLWVALPALTRILFEGERYERPSIVFDPPHQYRLLDVGVDSNQVAVIVAAALIAAAMTLLLRATPFGLAVRATVDAPRMAGAVGINTSFVSAGSWMVGTTLAGTAGVLLGSYRGFDELQFTFLVLGSFAAVVIARMHSLVLAFAGSILLGVVQELSKSTQVTDFLDGFVDAQSVWVRGLPASIPFVVMLVFLLAYRGLGPRAVRGRHARRRRARGPRGRRAARAVAAAAAGRAHHRPRRRRTRVPVGTVGGDRREGARARDRVPLVHDRDRRGRHDLALPDHVRRRRGGRDRRSRDEPRHGRAARGPARRARRRADRVDRRTPEPPARGPVPRARDARVRGARAEHVLRARLGRERRRRHRGAAPEGLSATTCPSTTCSSVCSSSPRSSCAT